MDCSIDLGVGVGVDDKATALCLLWEYWRATIFRRKRWSVVRGPKTPSESKGIMEVLLGSTINKGRESILLGVLAESRGRGCLPGHRNLSSCGRSGSFESSNLLEVSRSEVMIVKPPLRTTVAITRQAVEPLLSLVKLATTLGPRSLYLLDNAGNLVTMLLRP
jgi:hypothetical protein